MEHSKKSTLFWLIDILIAIAIILAIWYKLIITLQFIVSASLIFTFVLQKAKNVDKRNPLLLTLYFIDGAGIGALAYYSEISIVFTILALLVFVWIIFNALKKR